MKCIHIGKGLSAIALACCALLGGQNASAQIPVTDGASIMQDMVNHVETIAKWKAQYDQMKEQFDKLQEQYQQLQQTYQSLNGVRGMADVVNDPQARRYLPDEWQATMDAMTSGGGGKYAGLSGSFDQILAAMKPLSAANAGIGGESATAYTSTQKQAAMNRAIGEEGYKQASKRFDTIQQLLEKIKSAPDAKDIQDLQARIQTEQVMQQNEQTKLQLVSQLQQAQRDIQNQQAGERQMKSLKRRDTVAF